MIQRKTLLVFGVAIVIIIIAVSFYFIFRRQNKNGHFQSGGNSDDGAIFLTVKTGNAKIILADQKIKDVSISEKFYAPAEIKTGEKSSAILNLGNNSTVSLDENTNFKVEKSGKENSFFLFTGRIWARVLKVLESGEKFEVKTSNAVAGIRGTEFQVSYKNKKTKVIVFKNKVEVKALDPKTGNFIENVPAAILQESEETIIDETNPPTPKNPIEIRTINPENLIKADKWLEENIKSGGENERQNEANSASATPANQENKISPSSVFSPKDASSGGSQVKEPPRPISIEFAQKGPIFLKAGQTMKFDLVEVWSDGTKKPIKTGQLPFTFYIEGDPWLGEVADDGLFIAGPYAGKGKLKASITIRESIEIFEKSIDVEVQGPPVPLDYVPG
ncbi:FecR domain-containing protein [Candidatus Wolfebacteria bacterium]|nr:FecR domain-containing protein [Candidatus Wolfebacteria bacterium]